MAAALQVIDNSEFVNLQNRVKYLEYQLEQSLLLSRQKEAYANTLAVDLEHIISQLARLDIVS